MESNIQKENRVHVLQDITLSPVQAKTLKDHLKVLYPNLKRIRTKVDMEFPNCDVHLFRIPTSVDPFLLLNKEISLEEKCKLKLEEKYIIESTTQLPESRLFVSDNSKVLILRKNLMMKRYVKVKKQPQISVGEQSNIKLPENFKGHQQPFSPSFEDKIYLSEEVEKKLDKAIANMMKRKIKKKVRKTKQELENHHQNEEIYDLLNVQNPSAATMKVSDDSAISSCSSSINSKKKNKKDNESLLIKLLENTNQEVETSYETEAESKICKKKKKNKKDNESWLIKSLESTNQEVETSYETEAETKIHKKKKKSKKVEDIDVLSVETINKDVGNHAPQRKKIKSIVNSTSSLDAYRISSCIPNFSLIMPGTSDVLKEEKRKHKLNFSKTSNILDDISIDVSSPKKVKKKKKDRSLDN